MTGRRRDPLSMIVATAAVLVMGGTIVFAALSRNSDDVRPHDPAFAGVESRDLHFEDRDDGSVLVLDADTATAIVTLAPGEGGFTRSILRGLVRERRQKNVGGKSAFRLQRMANGGLMLGDPATGREVHLAAFGSSNVAAFERLMTTGGSTE